MKKTVLFRILFCGTLLPLVGRIEVSAADVPKKISPVHFLKPTDKIPSLALRSPAVPGHGPNGTRMEMEAAIGAPSADDMSKFSDPAFFEALKTEKKKETQIKQAYWLRGDDWDYCHFRDEAGNHWYGWNDGKKFQWILFKGNHYWWYDSFSGNWLYFGGRYWFRADLQTLTVLQVLIDGEYYLCQKDGTILKDMGQDGKGKILSGVAVQGGHQRGGHHGGGNHGGHETGGGSRSSEGTKALLNGGNSGNSGGQ